MSQKRLEDTQAPAMAPEHTTEQKRLHRRTRKRRKRNSTWLTLLGAGLVLLTFVVKDTKRDHLKDLTSSIESAQTAFRIQRQLFDLPYQFNSIQEAIEELPATKEVRKIRERDSKSELEKYYEKRQLTLSILIGAETEAIEDIESLQMNSTQPVSAELKRLGAIRKELATVTKEAAQLSHDRASIERRINEDELQGVLATRYEEINSIGESSLRRAKLAKATADESYEHYTQLSYVLYGLGWLLGLVGKLKGNADERDE